MAKKKRQDRAAARKAKKAAKKAASKTKSSGADAPAHANELKLAPGIYDRCADERHDLDPARTSFADKPPPPRALRGHAFTSVRRSKDGWAPGENKPPKCKLTYKQLAENWAAEHTPAELKQFKKDCVWGEWCPSMPPPDWWRLDIDDDATYRVLCFCWAYNFRCYQPVMGVDFDEFCTKALRKGSAVANGLIAIDASCRRISEKAWLEENEKPANCSDSVYVGFFT